MKFTARQYATLLYEIVANVKKSEIPDRIQLFLHHLVRARRTALMASIIAAFGEVWNERSGVTTIEVTSASKISKIIKDEMRNVLGAEKIEIDEHVDPSLIGGMRVRIGDIIIDGSIKNALNNMREKWSL